MSFLCWLFWDFEGRVVGVLVLALSALVFFGARSCVWERDHCKPTSEVRHEVSYISTGTVLLPQYYDTHKNICDDGSVRWR